MSYFDKHGTVIETAFSESAECMETGTASRLVR